ncbi:MAG: hypothetical protein RMJ15_00160 [Nitrososphaerota archaeon]|nr:hypothetical protein [Candidatus Bathyarchaeota archaeon]MDW8022149.1 hypothetical protein [Nitrososphaerota archaeon]
MGFKGRFRVESRGMLLATVYYALTGIIFFAVLASDFRLVHMAIMGIFSLASAYSLYGKRAWALWFILPLFFTATTFALFMLYYAVGSDMLLSVAMAVYLVLTWIFTFYAAAKRKELKS